MNDRLLYSLLSLAHATSRNLAFAHQPDVHVSYGEETITETNLLELRRRHPDRMRLTTFTRAKEALNGADWEWHIIGRRYLFRMRIQAKRLQSNGVLKIDHTVRKSGDKQIKLLIDDAALAGCMPVYCFYASEEQRARWKTEAAAPFTEQYEFGCLLARADRVAATTIRKLTDIEQHCVPWHYLVDPRRYARARDVDPGPVNGGEFLFFLRTLAELGQRLVAGETERGTSADFPTVDQLNGFGELDRDMPGLEETPPDALHDRHDRGWYSERGIGLLLELDVRDDVPDRPAPPSDRLRDRS